MLFRGRSLKVDCSVALTNTTGTSSASSGGEKKTSSLRATVVFDRHARVADFLGASVQFSDVSRTAYVFVVFYFLHAEISILF